MGWVAGLSMNTKSLWLGLPLVLGVLGSCAGPRGSEVAAPVLDFHGAGEGTELGVVSVRKGVERGAVEWHLVADLAGEERVTELLEEEFGMRRIRGDEDLEGVLRTKFRGVSGKDAARALWRRYEAATYSGLECGNATIVYFDARGRAVEAWPVLENVTGSNVAGAR